MALLQYPAWAAGQDITAASLTAMEISYVYKVAATSRASVTAFTDDPDLTFPVVAGGVYLIEWHMSYGGLAAAGFQTIWDVPVGSSGVKNCNGPGSSANNASAENIAGMYGSLQFTSQAQYGCARNATGSVQYAFENGIVHVGVAGNVALQWAQTTSNATADQLGIGSWGRCARLQ